MDDKEIMVTSYECQVCGQGRDVDEDEDADYVEQQCCGQPMLPGISVNKRLLG